MWVKKLLEIDAWEDDMKVIGILGGMGPLATVDLFKKIVVMTEAERDNDHIQIVVENNTKIPDRTDHIIHGGEDPRRHMIKSALRLEMMGADVVVMPCNTAHYFYDDIIEYLDIPFINMIAETAKTAKERFVGKKLALLATEGTYQAGIYDRVFQKNDLELVKPDEGARREIMDIIYKIKGGQEEIDTRAFRRVLDDLKKQGAGAFILGCTELPIAFERFKIEEACLDPTEILASAAIQYVDKRVKNKI